MQNSRYRIPIIAFILSCLGLLFTCYQHYKIELPFNPEQTTKVWSVEAKLEFLINDSKPVKVNLTIPGLYNANFINLNESFISRNYGTNIQVNKYHREIQWSKRRASGKQELYYKLNFYIPDNTLTLISPNSSPRTNIKPLYTAEGAEYLAVNALLEPIRSSSSDIFTFAAQAIKALNDKSNNNAKLLLSDNYTRENLANISIKLLSMAHIPAEHVCIIPLTVGKTLKALNWIKVYNGQNWEYFDPETSIQGLPDNSIVWSSNTNELAKVIGDKELIKSNLTFTVAQNKTYTIDLIKNLESKRYNKVLDFSLFSLPLHLQQIFQVLLMMPIGVFIILLLRVFIGLETFGTFMPVLIALSFRETGITWGIIFFVLITITGLLIRAYMENLKLLIIPRLAIVLTVVIIFIGILCILFNKLNLNNSLSVALFPIVILTMTIERMSILWEERGALLAGKIVLSSLLAAVIAFFAMSQPLLNYLIFTFPGLLLVLIAAMLLTGRYRGFRLLELIRFRELIYRSDLPK